MEPDRYLGCLAGLAVGDAIGTTAEFTPRGSFPPLTAMVGGGPFRLQPGQWTDDTSMALCLGHSLVHCKGFDPVDQMNRYCNWAGYGYMSSTGICFDVGSTVAAALQKYQATGNPFSGSTDPHSAGNGAIMRLAPVPMFFASSLEDTVHYSGESARTTHGAPEAVDCARLFGALIRAALHGLDKETLLVSHGYEPQAPSIHGLANGAYRHKTKEEIRGSGYVVESLEAALWCFLTTSSYRDAVLLAANLGNDADTTAAVCGQLAGAHYGISAIPAQWRQTIAMRQEIEALALRLFELRIT